MLGQQGKVEKQAKKSVSKVVKILRVKGKPDQVEVKRDGFSDEELAQENKGEPAGKQGMITSTGGTEKLSDEAGGSGRKLVTAGKPTTTGEQYRKPRAERIPRITGGRGFRITPRRPMLPR